MIVKDQKGVRHLAEQFGEKTVCGLDARKMPLVPHPPVKGWRGLKKWEFRTCNCSQCRKNNNILNFTPHEIVLFYEEEKIMFPPQESDLFRLHEERKEFYIRSFPFPLDEINYTFKLDSLLKNPSLKDKYIIVSKIVGDYISNYVKNNNILLPFHLISPDTGEAVRDEKGRILGVRGFIFHI